MLLLFKNQTLKVQVWIFTDFGCPILGSSLKSINKNSDDKFTKKLLDINTKHTSMMTNKKLAELATLLERVS